MKRSGVACLFATVLLGTAGLGVGVTHASQRIGPTRQPAAPAPAASPAAAPQSVSAAPAPLRMRPELIPGPALLQTGSRGEQVRDLEARLKQIGWYADPVSADYDGATVLAVRGFQAKRGIAVTGRVDQRTLARLRAMTRTPTREELFNIAPPSTTTTDAALDPRCLTGRAMCVDKTSRTLRWVVDGKVLKTVDVRFGSTINNTPTREGAFHVGWKSRDHVSKLYDSSMPFAMFFSGGQAVHYSSDFAARGYNGASHGCVNVRDYDAVKWLFDQVSIGDKVIVYWS